MESMQATEEEVSEQALCRTCGGDEGGGKMPCPECEARGVVIDKELLPD